MVTREDLYDLVWSTPMTKVAERFEVSGSYMARVCTVLNVPRPERGYWAKLAVGKAPARKPLPAARPGDQLSWSREGDLSPPPRPRLPLQVEPASPASGPKHAIHGLIRGARQHFETGYPVEEGGYLKPYKKLLVDVTASKACLDKALGFANDLFNALESAGHRVLLAPPNEGLRRAAVDEREERTKKRDHWEHRYPRLWSPHRPTVVYIGTVPVGLTIVEMSETVVMRYVGGRYIRDAEYKAPKVSRHYVDRTWTTTQCVPSGRLRLVAYAAYPRVSWSADWQETAKASLKPSLPAIVKTIQEAAAGLIEKLEEANRQAEIERLRWQAEQERWRREDDRRRVQQSIKESREQLGQIIEQWSRVMDVSRFLKGVEEQASMLAGEARRRTMQRLALAREFLGTQPRSISFWRGDRRRSATGRNTPIPMRRWKVVTVETTRLNLRPTWSPEGRTQRSLHRLGAALALPPHKVDDSRPRIAGWFSQQGPDREPHATHQGIFEHCCLGRLRRFLSGP